MYGQQQQQQQQPVFVQSPYPPQFVTSNGLVQAALPPQPLYSMANQQPMAPLMYAPTMTPFATYAPHQTPSTLPVLPEHQAELSEKYTHNFSFCGNMFLGLLTILFGICAIGGGILEVISWSIYFKYKKLGSPFVDDLLSLFNETGHNEDTYDNYSYYVGFWSGIMIIAGGSVIVSSRHHNYGVLQSAIGAIFGMAFAIVQLILSALPMTQSIVHSDYIKGIPLLYAGYIVLIVSAAATILSTLIICIACLVALVDGICCQSTPDVRSSSSRSSRVVPMYDANVAQPGYISPACTYFPYPPPPSQSYSMGPTVLQVAPYCQPAPVFSPTQPAQPTQPQSIPPTPAPVQAQAQYQSQSQFRLATASPPNANANAAPTTTAGPAKTPAAVPVQTPAPVQVKPPADTNAQPAVPVKTSIDALPASPSVPEIIPENPTGSVHGAPTRPVPPTRPAASSVPRTPGLSRTPVPIRAPATQVRVTPAPAARPTSSLPVKSPGGSETNVVADNPPVASPVQTSKE